LSKGTKEEGVNVINAAAFSLFCWALFEDAIAILVDYFVNKVCLAICSKSPKSIKESSEDATFSRLKRPAGTREKWKSKARNRFS